ncbi:hypothetical protein MMC22_006877 [Lobaria immixta]|nr:hypothetical protein [Lobaria immixta]
MSASLAALLTEVVNCILANIKSKHTLCNLARCSRRLCLCTTPYLYRHVVIQEESGRGELRNGPLRELAPVLLRRPDLASLVRQFTLHAVPPSRMRAKSSEDSEYPEELEYAAESEEEVSAKIAKVDQGLKTAVEAWDHPDLILALLLPALLKVETLVLDFKPLVYASLLEPMMRRAARRERPFDVQPSFEVLRVFACARETDARTTDLIASLLQLHSIQEISGGFMNTLGNDEPGKKGALEKGLLELDSYSSSLISLDLTAYSLSTASLVHILRAPKALQTFLYKVCECQCVDLTDIRHALGPQENSLESLVLNNDEERVRTHTVGFLDTLRRRTDSEPMASLMSFNTLKFFKTAALFLETTENGVGRYRLMNVFPPSLETLHLTDFQVCFESVLEAVERLLRQKSPWQIPSLTNFILEQSEYLSGFYASWQDEPWRDRQEAVIENLSLVAAAQGVSVGVLEWTDQESLAGEWGQVMSWRN